jgi:arsenate reductase (glutaredoxin)
MEVQIFGVRNSSETRAAERFFKERRVKIHMVDLGERPIAPGELKRFTDRFGWDTVLDREGKVFQASGLEFMKLSETTWLERIADEPKLLKLPLVRAGKHVTIGKDEMSWKAMLETK